MPARCLAGIQNAEKRVGSMTPNAHEVDARCSGEAMTRHATFPGRPEEVRTARRFVAKSLNGCPAAGDAVLLVSELATNALAHSNSGRGGSFTVAVIHRAGDVRVEVADQGGTWAPGDGARTESGRGLLVVFTLARACGITGDDSGRTAWFELDCP